jgi:hypothetical protein
LPTRPTGHPGGKNEAKKRALFKKVLSRFTRNQKQLAKSGPRLPRFFTFALPELFEKGMISYANNSVCESLCKAIQLIFEENQGQALI